jgi:hypothetical protein
MDLSSYVLAGFDFLPKTNVTIGGKVVEALMDLSTHRDNKTLGGYEPDNEATLSIKTSLLTNPKSLKGTKLSIDGVEWRVASVRYGQTITHLTVVSKDKA